MPLPLPAGALKAAHRILCVRCMRMMKKHPDHQCQFDKKTSKKCSYCTSQNSTCCPIPWFCDEEFEDLRLSNHPQDVMAAATAMDAIITVVASEAPKNVAETNFAILEELRALRNDLPSLTQNINDGLDRIELSVDVLADTMLKKTSEPAPTPTKGGRRSERIQKKGKGGSDGKTTGKTPVKAPYALQSDEEEDPADVESDGVREEMMEGTQ
ncbi:hypothetical protein N431DRAFT_433250 [Stipitochalara longipes BDJ]|nr:hypothetical protein N431DRAFT_433250 [Stipitochalara longipes BDJ]